MGKSSDWSAAKATETAGEELAERTEKEGLIMSEESQAVQTMVSAAEKGAEATARIALETGKGVLHTAKSIVALAAALIKSHPKSKGKIKLTKMVSQGKELVPFQILERDKATFHKLAKDYGITYVMVKNSKTQDGRVEVIAKAEDAGRINRIIERLGYPAPTREGEEKNAVSRTLSKEESKEYGSFNERSMSTMSTRTNEERKRTSVRDRVEKAKAALQKSTGKNKVREHTVERRR